MEQLNQTPTQEKELSLEEKERMEKVIHNWVGEKIAELENAFFSYGDDQSEEAVSPEEWKEAEDKIRPEIKRIHDHKFSSEEIIEMIDKADFFVMIFPTMPIFTVATKKIC